MAKLPLLNRKKKICVICEGNEDYFYFQRLNNLNVWSSAYELQPINAKGASTVFARFEDAYQNDRYDLILVFCDTDKAPYREYSQIKYKINRFLGKQRAAEKLIIFANPCTMQIILSHFGEVFLKSQGKKTNAAVIEKWTGVKNYDAHEDQIKIICGMIFQRTYSDMRKRVAAINFPDTTTCSTNFITFLDRFESDNDKWVDRLAKFIRE